MDTFVRLTHFLAASKSKILKVGLWAVRRFFLGVRTVIFRSLSTFRSTTLHITAKDL